MKGDSGHEKILCVVGALACPLLCTHHLWCEDIPVTFEKDRVVEPHMFPWLHNPRRGAGWPIYSGTGLVNPQRKSRLAPT